MTTTLTDRYVSATLRRVPEKQRPEIAQELRAAIADDVDARIDQGDKPAKAEYDALQGMGDPYRLAASYTNHSLSLIGPDIYPTYVRSLKILGWTVLPVVYVVLLVISAAQGKNVAASIFGPLGTTISVAIYISFIVTLLFAIAERTASNRSSEMTSALTWTPDRLPLDVEPPSMKRWGDVITQVTGTLFIVGFVLFDRYSPIVTKHGHGIPVLAPHLWAFWIPLFLGILAVTVIFEFIKLRVGRWTIVTALTSSILGLLGAATLIIAILTSTVVNPALTTTPDLVAGSWIWVIAAIVIAVIWLGTTINTWRPSTRKQQPDVA